MQNRQSAVPFRLHVTETALTVPHYGRGRRSQQQPEHCLYSFHAEHPHHGLQSFRPFTLPDSFWNFGKTPLDREGDDQPRGATSVLTDRDLSS